MPVVNADYAAARAVLMCGELGATVIEHAADQPDMEPAYKASARMAGKMVSGRWKTTKSIRPRLRYI